MSGAPLTGTGLQPTDRAQIDQVLAAMQELGLPLIGAYLHGSAVLGGLRPWSDLDVFAVSRRPTTRGEKQRLAARLLDISGSPSPGPPRPIELTVVVETAVRPWRYPPSFDFVYGEWLRAEFEQGNVEPWETTEDPDLAPLITMVLLAGTPLLGPPPAEVLPPIPHDDLLRAIVGDVDRLLSELATDTRNVILTLARIWCTLETGRIHAKDAAADWALPWLPAVHRPVLARARAIYLGERDEQWDDLAPRLDAFAAHVTAEIRRLARSRV